MSIKRLLPCGCVAAGLLLLPVAARAQNCYWNVSSGDWSVASNWTGGVPTSNSYAYITNGGTATVSPTGQACYQLDVDSGGSLDVTAGSLMAGYNFAFIGNVGTGSVVQSGGVVTAQTFLIIGQYSGSSGTYTLSGGLVSGGVEELGYWARGCSSNLAGPIPSVATIWPITRAARPPSAKATTTAAALLSAAAACSRPT